MSSNKDTSNVSTGSEIIKTVPNSEKKISNYNPNDANDLKSIVSNELTRISTNKLWIWYVLIVLL